MVTNWTGNQLANLGVELTGHYGGAEETKEGTKLW